MKVLKFILLVFPFFLSCGKDVAILENPNGGTSLQGKSEMSFLVNGYEWKGTPRITSKTWFHLGLNKDSLIDGIIIPNESFSLLVVRKKMTKQRLFLRDSNVNFNPDIANTCASFSTMKNGDVSCESFNVLDSDSLNNFVIITKENNNYQEIWGEFSVSFIKKKTCNSPVYKDTVRVRNGKFHVFFE